jgi:hypothetical protein
LSTASLLHRAYSTQTYLVLLVLVVLVPVLVFAGVLLQRSYEAEHEHVQNELQDDARQLTIAVDRDLAGLITTLQTLATSGFLAGGDYAAFHRRLVETRRYVGVHILVRDLSGQQLANTRVPFGEKLPLEPLEGDQEVIATRRPYVSDILIGTVALQPVLTITVPVVQPDGRMTHLLNISIPTEHMTKLVTTSVSNSQRAGIIDRKGLFITRTVDPDKYIATPAPPAFRTVMGQKEGFIRDIDVEGRPVIRAFVRSPLSGWLIWTSVPEDALTGDLRRSLWLLLAFGSGLTTIALGCAYLIGRRISGAIYRLSAAGRALDNE